ncbi:hypothetical protein [Mycolicibacterium sphagni]|uniref:Uncharacterized protein n=1 Tax=Mycolicibacterium sphagni TaxID=1786 RepID=A0ABX2JUQ0_9MYCO|nr:hypothetical protein [Mycolicibacterium sphagni]NTY61135.1 hypothetical protein [Mycolicibacterium sphagni]
MGKDADEEKGDDGHDGQQTIWIYVSGVAAIVLLVMLVYAVMDTAESSQRRDGPVTYAPAISTTPTTTSRKTSTTSRTTSPRISTTDMNPSSGPPPSPSETAGELTSPPETDYTTPTTTVTMTNPYATTSPPNAGHT